MLLFVFLRGGFSIHCHSANEGGVPAPSKPFLWLRGRTIGALRAERHTLTSAEWTSCSACHELLCSRAFLLIVLRSAQHPQIPRFMQIFRGIWPMPLSLLSHSALPLFAQSTRIPTSSRSIGFCAIWVCISSSLILINGGQVKQGFSYCNCSRVLLPVATSYCSAVYSVKTKGCVHVCAV